MPTATITVTPYNGSLLAANLLSGQRTLVLNSLGTSTSGVLSDADGLLSTSDNGVATFNGAPITYIGSGTVTPGVNVLRATVPLGVPRPVVAFQVGGSIYFHYPEGPPNLLSAVAVVIQITPAPYQVLIPICFCAGTRIDTPDGPRPVESLGAGDHVTDIDGRPRPILWAGARMIDLPLGLVASYAKWLPVRIPANAFGPGGRPDADLYLSQQHSVLIEGAGPELVTGAARVLVPAKALIGDRVALDRSCRRVAYHHLLCDGHAVILANNLPCETLLPAALPRYRDWASAGQAADDPPHPATLPPLVPADGRSLYPILAPWQARVLRP